jgi:hypothetical protein
MAIEPLCSPHQWLRQGACAICHFVLVEPTPALKQQERHDNLVLDIFRFVGDPQLRRQRAYAWIPA